VIDTSPLTTNILPRSRQSQSNVRVAKAIGLDCFRHRNLRHLSVSCGGELCVSATRVPRPLPRLNVINRASSPRGFVWVWDGKGAITPTRGVIWGEPPVLVRVWCTADFPRASLGAGLQLRPGAIRNPHHLARWVKLNVPSSESGLRLTRLKVLNRLTSDVEPGR